MAHKWMLPLCLALLSSLAGGLAAASELAAGPMVGPPAMRAVTIWIQGKSAARAQIEFWPEAEPKRKHLSKAITLREADDFTAHFVLSDLQPGVHYAYRVLFAGKPVSAIHKFATQPLWQWRSDPPDFKVLLGSCAYINEPAYDRPGKPYGGATSIFTQMAAAKPDLTLWLGDNVYYREVDYDHPASMAARWHHDRKLPDLQPLLTTGAHAAIWDDHDYGPNDANASFDLKEHALELFKRYWTNPSYGLPEAPGVFTRFRFGDAEFFLLDNRWYRDADMLKDEEKSMFGERQLRWLKNALVNSVATFKFIAAGSQMLDRSSPFEGWRHFEKERQNFIDWLTRQGVQGVFFLSGDRHRTEMLRWDRANAYPLYELTCSPLTAGTYDLSLVPLDPGLVEGTRVGERNYCSLEISGQRNQRTLTVSSFAADGRLLWRKKFHQTELMDSSTRQ